MANWFNHDDNRIFKYTQKLYKYTYSYYGLDTRTRKWRPEFVQKNSRYKIAAKSLGIVDSKDSYVKSDFFTIDFGCDFKKIQTGGIER